MDYEKIGKFLSELRKEQGMPELSSIIPLCEVLKINVNELISGEKLTEVRYSERLRRI